MHTTRENPWRSRAPRRRSCTCNAAGSITSCKVTLEQNIKYLPRQLSISQLRRFAVSSSSIHMASTPASSGQPKATLSSEAGAGGKRLLCALDASEHSVRALRFALDKIVKPEQGDKVILFQAAEPIKSERPWSRPIDRQLNQMIFRIHVPYPQY